MAVWGWVFFFQAEDGIRDVRVTGVQTCALPIAVAAEHAGARAATVAAPAGEAIGLGRDRPQHGLRPARQGARAASPAGGARARDGAAPAHGDGEPERRWTEDGRDVLVPVHR